MSDSVSDAEAIWERVKNHIDTSRLQKSQNYDELKKNIEKAMQERPTVSGKQGDLRRLLKPNLLDKFADLESKNVSFSKPVEPFKRPKRPKKEVQLLPNNSSYTSSGRVSLRNAKGDYKGTFAEKNLKFTARERNGKTAIYVSRPGKGLLTWGFV